MNAVVAAFNQEKALVGAFSVITNLRIAFVWISSRYRLKLMYNCIIPSAHPGHWSQATPRSQCSKQPRPVVGARDQLLCGHCHVLSRIVTHCHAIITGHGHIHLCYNLYHPLYSAAGARSSLCAAQQLGLPFIQRSSVIQSCLVSTSSDTDRFTSLLCDLRLKIT